MDREQRLQEWLARIEDYRNSGRTMSAWCEAQGISIHQLKYWQKRLKRLSQIREADSAGSAAVRWRPVSVTPSSESPKPEPGLVIRIGQASVEVNHGFDPQLLRQVVQTLMSVC